MIAIGIIKIIPAPAASTAGGGEEWNMDVATYIIIILSAVAGLGMAIIVGTILKPFMRQKNSLRWAISIIVFLVYGIAIYALRLWHQETNTLYYCLVWIPFGVAVLVILLSLNRRSKKKAVAKAQAQAAKEEAAAAQAAPAMATSDAIDAPEIPEAGQPEPETFQQ